MEIGLIIISEQIWFLILWKINFSKVKWSRIQQEISIIKSENEEKNSNSRVGNLKSNSHVICSSVKNLYRRFNQNCERIRYTKVKKGEEVLNKILKTHEILNESPLLSDSQIMKKLKDLDCYIHKILNMKWKTHLNLKRQVMLTMR